MTIGLLYWILMLFWAVFGLWNNWPAGRALGPGDVKPLGGGLLLFILLVLLGWKMFGSPVQG